MFNPFSIVAGTGVSSSHFTNFSFFGDLTFLGSSASFLLPSALPLYSPERILGGAPAIFISSTPMGPYLTLCTSRMEWPEALFLTGVLIDPPASVTFDILGFTNPRPEFAHHDARAWQPFSCWGRRGCSLSGASRLDQLISPK